MRNFLYDTTGRVCIIFAGVADFTSNAICLVAVGVFGFLKVQFAHLCMFLLKVIDGKRVELERAQNEQERSMTEMNLMMAAVRVKENAEEMDDWPDEHSETLNMIGVTLIQERNWEPEQVHSYFKPLVESIGGLDYGS